MKLCDLHNDFLVELQTESERANYIKLINKNKNIKYICGAVYSTHLKNPIDYLNKIKKELDKYDKRKKIILCIEDLSFINRRNVLNIIKNIIEIQPFYCTLVWNFDNKLGGGAYGKKGLTKLGKIVVSILEKNNIIIDTAHMNKKTFYDFCKITKFKIFNSHSNIYSLKIHKRNVTSKQLEYIKNSNGVLGLSFVQDFISNAEISDKNIINQIKYMIENKYLDCICFGTDFYGTNKLPNNIKNYSDIFKILIKNLLKLKIKRKAIKKIFYKNFLTFKKSLYNKKKLLNN